MDCRKIFACAFAVLPLVTSGAVYAQSSTTVLVPANPYSNDPQTQRENAELYANSYDSHFAPDPHQTKREREAHPKEANDAYADSVAAEARADVKARAAGY